MATSFITKDFIERILRRSENDDTICVTDLTIKPATNKGDNYTSDMHRVTVDFKHNKGVKMVNEKRPLIVKVAPTIEGVHKELIEQAGLFIIEMKMMTTTLREMELLLKDSKLGGKCYYTQETEPKLLVIEDLAPLGFRMADRQAGLDLDHCMLAMRGLAKFHASSVGVLEKNPKYKEMYHKGIFNSNNPPDMTRFFTSGMKTLAKAVEHWPELDKSYSDKLMKLADVAYNRASDVSKPIDNEFNVINHGDFWVNNMLFRYGNDGKVCDHIFVDFQLCLYGSPAIDLLYFLNTSPSVKVLNNHQNELLNEYLKVLTVTMKKIGCKASPPTMTQLQDAMIKREVYGFVAACTILPIVLIDKCEAQNLEEIMGQDDENFNNKAYDNENYKNQMIQKLPRWESLGLLD